MKCPTCGTEAIRVNDKDGKLIPNTYKCPNPECTNTGYIVAGIDPLSPQGADSFWAEYCREFSGHGADDGYERHEY